MSSWQNQAVHGCEHGVPHHDTSRDGPHPVLPSVQGPTAHIQGGGQPRYASCLYKYC